jgi:hypothetical protein
LNRKFLTFEVTSITKFILNILLVYTQWLFKKTLFLFKLSHVKHLNLWILHKRKVETQASQVDYKESYTVPGAQSHRDAFILFPEH